jgi:uncharacterized protein
MKTVKPYWNNYIAGFALGIILFLSFYITGNGLGSSGALQRFLVFFQDLISPSHVNTTPYLAKMAGGDRNPLDHWLVIEVIGVLLGGLTSGWLSGRLKLETFHGPRITPKTRWIMAFIGGGIVGYGARLSRGCTSGQALSGGAVLSAGSWAFMLAMFAGAYGLAWFVRRFWISGGDHGTV